MSGPSVVNLFDHRLARAFAPLRDKFTNYAEAAAAAADWTATADQLWDELVGDLSKLIRQMPAADPTGFAALQRWYRGENGVFNLPAISDDKLVELIARGIVSMFATLVTSEDLLDDGATPA